MRTMPGKTRKSLLKRFKIKKKKVLRLGIGIGHNLAKKDSAVKKRKKKFKPTDEKLLKYLNY